MHNLNIKGMVPGGIRRCSTFQPILEPSPISTAAPLESPEGPIEAGSSEMGSSEPALTGIFIFFI